MPYVAVLMLLIMACCGHVGPEGGQDDGDEQVELGFSLRLDDKWRSNDLTAATRNDEPPYRVSIYIVNAGGQTYSRSFNFTKKELQDGVSFPNTIKLDRDAYNIIAFCERVDNDNKGVAYEYSNFHYLTPKIPNGTFDESRFCFYSRQNLDIRRISLDNKSVDILLSNMTGRVEFIADDYDKFLEQNPDILRQEGHLEVRVDYKSEIPGAFDLVTDELLKPLSGVNFTTEFGLSSIPGIEAHLTSDCHFAIDDPVKYMVEVSIFNSAKVLISKLENVEFPVRRGMITTVHGDFLTNSISGGIIVDTSWGNEINIEI